MSKPLCGAPLEAITAAAFTIPTETEEADGTLTWHSTTLAVVEAKADGQTGLGYTYADRAAAVVIQEHLAPLLKGREALDVRAAWEEMNRAVRNLGRAGIAATAISAVDTALWDLKARLLGVPLVKLFGQVRPAMPLYGSGGFTNYTAAQLGRQFTAWQEEGITMFKMKIGRDPAADLRRIAEAREVIDEGPALFVDANGAYSRKTALAQAERFRAHEITWFEEPVSSDDLEGLRLLRDGAPMEIAAGEYGYHLDYFRRMLSAGTVDVLQADATRCGGYTGFLAAAALAEAFHLPLSAHCAPALHLPLGCAVGGFRHAEYFFDHARIERLLFEGLPPVRGGQLTPELSAPGHGLTFRWADAQRYAV